MALIDDGNELFSDGGILCLTRPKNIFCDAPLVERSEMIVRKRTLEQEK